jgi:uncharacterized membrane protein (UPF0182 family)
VINRESVPIRRSRSGRRWPTIIIIIVVAALLTGRFFATLWTDYLWYQSVDHTAVWRTLVFTRVGLVVVASLVAFGLFWGNLWLVDRLSPRRRAPAGTPEEELLARFQDWIEPRVRRVRLAVSGFFGLMLGLGASVWWREWLLFRNGTSFGANDPIFNNDLSLYVFKLPFYQVLFGWFFQLILVIAVVSASIHYLNGAVEFSFNRRVQPGVKVHLSVLFAFLALLKAVGYLLNRWELLFSERGQVFGASYTDVKAQLPALNLLILISVVAAGILLVNLRFRGWTLPIVALSLWLGTSILVGGLYPALIQRFRVVPDEVNKEETYVGYNIDATLAAYGLDNIQVTPFAASTNLDRAALDQNQETIDNIRLWDPGVLVTTYQQLQNIKTYYNINDVDVDRYNVAGSQTQVMVSARELDEANVPGGGWVNEKLVYTHGYGSVVSPANAVTTEGQPAFLVKDIPPVTSAPSLTATENRIYFSDGATGAFAIVGSKQAEVDYPISEATDNVKFTSYDGQGGVRLGGIFRRLAFALRYADLDTLISGQLTPDSKVLMERNILDRVNRLAPFLYPDSDPYLIITQEGRLVWMIDMYTVTDNYPYSQAAPTDRLNRTSTLPDNFNYIRNSVKATVDAFDGTVTLYVMDPEDPLIQTQAKIFPGVFVDGSQMPEDIRNHIRYPEDLFRIQSDQYTLYHITNPAQFFQRVDPWDIARDPSTANRPPLRAESASGEARPMLPYYLLLSLPGENDLSFLIMQPFTPKTRPNMVSFLVAKSDPQDYGQMIEYRLPAASQQDGPGQVGALINQNTEISAEFTLLGQSGSKVIQGSMLVLPVNESLLYVQPIYIQAETATSTSSSSSGLGGTAAADSGTGIPEFKRVVVSYNGDIQMRETLTDALEAVFGSATGGNGGGSTGDGGTTPVPQEVAALVDAAQQALADADQALRDGDLGTYADKVAEAKSLIGRAKDLIDSGTTASTGG